jgi:hydrogenase maturation protease
MEDLRAHAPVAIVGCGNPTRSDDGAGIRVVQLLATQHADWAACGVRVFDAGTDGLSVLFAARGCKSLILVDACRSGAAPGTIFEVPGNELESDFRPSLNLHEFRWDHALAAGRKIYGASFPKYVVVFLIEARSVDFGLELSPEVETSSARVATRIEALALALARATASVAS